MSKPFESDDTESLLDRVTVYRSGMEPEAVHKMEAVLARRGITLEEIAEHLAERSETALWLADGTAVRCTFCDRPAVVQKWGWHRLFGRFPVFPRYMAHCEQHL